MAARFSEMDPPVDKIPERSVLGRFRQGFRAQRFERYLAAAGLELKCGTSVDSTLIAASSSPPTKAQSRDPDVTSTRKGNQYHLGLKLPLGADTLADRDSILNHAESQFRTIFSRLAE